MMNDQGALTPANIENHSFISMKNYIATVSACPMIDPDTRRLSFIKEDFIAIKNDLKLILLKKNMSSKD